MRFGQATVGETWNEYNRFQRSSWFIRLNKELPNEGEGTTMTHNPDQQTDETAEPTRRTFLKTGSLAVAGAGLTATGLGSVMAQDGDGGLFDEQNASEGVMYPAHFNPNALFTITSPPIDNAPEGADDLFEGLFTDYNMRIIRYINPVTQNVPLFPQEEADIGQFEERFGFVVDDDFVQDDEVVLDGTPLADLNEKQLGQIRPRIFALAQNTEPFQDSDNLVSVQFSPIPQQEEQRIFEENRDAIFGGPDPFGPAQQGTTEGGGNRTTVNQTDGNQTGNQSSFNG